MRRFVQAICVCTLALVAASCTKTIDPATLESALKTQMESKTGVSGITISCPDEIKAEAGGTFTCTATAQGETVTLEVTQTDDQGHVTFKTAA